MKPIRKIASELLGFDRRERRATCIIVVIMLILLIARYISLRPDNEKAARIIMTAGDPSLWQTVAKEANLNFMFDPNKVSYDTLVILGLTERQARTFINYRNNGARFHEPEDIGRVYGLDSLTVARLVPWVTIEEKKKSSITTTLNKPGRSTLQPVREPDDRTYECLDLNSCSAADLERLPGIGIVLSERIIRYRDLLGGFTESGQISEVYGLDSATVELIRDKVTVTEDAVRMIMLDTCSFSQMARHPYIGPEIARAVMKFRSLMGVSFTLADLVSQRVISASQAERMAPYVSTGSSRAER